MAQSTRSYYGVQGLFIKPDGQAGAYGFVHGVQSASDNAEISKQDVNEWGQITVYQIVESTPTVSIDVERVLDGCAPIYLLATEGAPSASLTGRQDQKCIIAIANYDSSADYIEDDPIKTVEFSGMQVNSISYSFTTDGPFTETVSFVGNYMQWSSGASLLYGTLPSDPTNGGTDEPCAYTACSGGVQFKENLVFSSGETYQTLLPTQIAGITSGGFNVVNAGGCPNVPIQSIEISVDLSREDIPALGCRGNYARLASFPVDVSLSITVLNQDGHSIDITETGGTTTGCRQENAPNQRFRLVTESGMIIDLGDRLKLDTVSTSWGDASGSNAEDTYSFTGKSVMSVFHTVSDPSSIVYAGTP